MLLMFALHFPPQDTRRKSWPPITQSHSRQTTTTTTTPLITPASPVTAETHANTQTLFSNWDLMALPSASVLFCVFVFSEVQLMIPNKVSALKKRFYVHVCSDTLLKDKFTIFNSHLYIYAVFCLLVFSDILCLSWSRVQIINSSEPKIWASDIFFYSFLDDIIE